MEQQQAGLEELENQLGRPGEEQSSARAAFARVFNWRTMGGVGMLLAAGAAVVAGALIPAFPDSTAIAPDIGSWTPSAPPAGLDIAPQPGEESFPWELPPPAPPPPPAAEPAQEPLTRTVEGLQLAYDLNQKILGNSQAFTAENLRRAEIYVRSTERLVARGYLNSAVLKVEDLEHEANELSTRAVKAEQEIFDERWALGMTSAPAARVP